MSRSFQLPMSSKDLNRDTIEMNMEKEMSSEKSTPGQEFIHETEEETLIVGDIEIKREEMDIFHLHHNSTAQAHSEDQSDPGILESMCNIVHVDVDCGSNEAEEKDLKDFYLDLLLCERDCETCIKYTRLLREHVRAAHAPPQPIHDPLLIDPVPLTHQPSSSIQIKSEVDENIMERSCSVSVSEEVCTPMTPSSDSDPDYNMESDIDPDSDSDSDSDPSPSLTPKPPRPPQSSVKNNNASSQPRSSKSSSSKSKSGEKRFKCDVCKKRFSQRRDLRRHRMIHSEDEERLYECDVCAMRFKSSYYLIAHMRIHTGTNPFKCDACEKSFPSVFQLTEHRRIHTGERPYQCDECEKSFRRKSHLTRHKGIHTKEKGVE